MKRSRLSLFISLLVACLVGCEEHPTPRGPRVGDQPAIEGEGDLDEGASLTPFITSGTFDSGHLSVGILASGSARCSATLIGKRTVLTAGHCVKTSSVSFTVEGTKYYSAKVVRHPGYGGGNRDDVAVVILQQEVTGVAPSPINTAPVTVGQQVILVGYGKTGEYSGGFGTKRVGHNTISSVGQTTFKFLGSSNVCNGDSGGPSFVVVNGEEHVAGVHSTKSGACGSGGTDMRVDSSQQWISQTANGDLAQPGQGGPGSPPPPPPPPPSGPAKEGEACDSRACDQGLACVTVFSGNYTQTVGKFCMEQCQSVGADPICDGGEVCTESKTAGKVCFNANNPGQGYTNPDPNDQPGTPPQPPPPPQNPPAPPPPPPGDCHQGSLFDWSYCSSSCPCAEGEGDCDGDSQCQTGLVCKHNVGTKYGASSMLDVCEKPAGGGDGGSCHGTKSNFDWSYCSSSCPCADGEGDCDSDAECKSGLVCKHNVGAQYGASSGVDVCTAPSGGGTPPPGTQPPPNNPPPPGSPAPAKEGESCETQTCDQGLACVTVYSAGYAKVVGKYCMEQCQTLGSDPACDGGEVCTQSKTAGKVCFNASNPSQGYTSPGDSSPPGGGTPPPPPGGNNPPPGGSGPCGFNTMEHEVFNLLNAERAKNGAGALQCDPAAVKVARAHSQDMCNRKYFSHTTPEGKSPWDRLKAGGVSFSSAGENIAWGQTSAQQVHNSWMNSSGHRKNMLNPSWVRVGIGYVKCTGKPYWTEVFMR